MDVCFHDYIVWVHAHQHVEVKIEVRYLPWFHLILYTKVGSLSWTKSSPTILWAPIVAVFQVIGIEDLLTFMWYWSYEFCSLLLYDKWPAHRGISLADFFCLFITISNILFVTWLHLKEFIFQKFHTLQASCIYTLS